MVLTTKNHFALQTRPRENSLSSFITIHWHVKGPQQRHLCSTISKGWNIPIFMQKLPICNFLFWSIFFRKFAMQPNRKILNGSLLWYIGSQLCFHHEKSTSTMFFKLVWIINFIRFTGKLRFFRCRRGFWSQKWLDSHGMKAWPIYFQAKHELWSLFCSHTTPHNSISREFLNTWKL